jgi:hypothetical protein
VFDKKSLVDTDRLVENLVKYLSDRGLSKNGSMHLLRIASPVKWSPDSKATLFENVQALVERLDYGERRLLVDAFRAMDVSADAYLSGIMKNEKDK